jgi:hypothetical protein
MNALLGETFGPCAASSFFGFSFAMAGVAVAISAQPKTAAPAVAVVGRKRVNIDISPLKRPPCQKQAGVSRGSQRG